MNSAQSNIHERISKALETGPVAEPEALLATLKGEADPLSTIDTTYINDDLSSAIERDFAKVSIARNSSSSTATESEAEASWAVLVRWFIVGVTNWKKEDDEARSTLAALLMTSRLCGDNNGLWHALPDALTPTPDLLAVLEQVLSHRKILYSSRGSGAPPIWETEFVEAFQKADTESDWQKLAEMWPRLEDAAPSRPALIEMVSCLVRFDFDRLVRAADVLDQTPAVMDLVRTLPIGQRLDLAKATSSERVRFCVVLSFGAKRAQPDELLENWMQMLSDLLMKVAASDREWRKWMAAFNTYPSRYPLLQEALGLALARSSLDAAKIYLEAFVLRPIPLTGSDEGRLRVSDCMRAFEQRAPHELRRAVWTHAHHLWLDWRIGAGNPQTHLSGINHSLLDYAVARYAEECMSAEERNLTLEELRSQMAAVDLLWHENDTDCTSEWNRLMSLFQPYAGASVAGGSGNAVLPETQVYYPFDPSQSLYHRIQFRISDPLKPGQA
ncbi:hypothetical protein A6U85_31865 [Agrobacterium sp. 13-626]|jgi:hypothetical protein|nr:hypothetical protein A6U85_31865 [Agrobacterium sp. 13-626]